MAKKSNNWIWGGGWGSWRGNWMIIITELIKITIYTLFIY